MDLSPLIVVSWEILIKIKATNSCKTYCFLLSSDSSGDGMPWQQLFINYLWVLYFIQNSCHRNIWLISLGCFLWAARLATKHFIFDECEHAGSPSWLLKLVIKDNDSSIFFATIPLVWNTMSRLMLSRLKMMWFASFLSVHSLLSVQ